MKEKKQELELSYISESSGFKHKVLDVKTIATLTAAAKDEIKNEDVEMSWMNDYQF